MADLKGILLAAALKVMQSCHVEVRNEEVI